MLFINWRKHYDLPNLVYYHNTFRKDRKAKFYFLSDLMFRLIHKYCFRSFFHYYIKSIFSKRFLYATSRFTNMWNSSKWFFNLIKTNNTDVSTIKWLQHCMEAWSKKLYYSNYNFYLLKHRIMIKNIKKDITIMSYHLKNKKKTNILLEWSLKSKYQSYLFNNKIESEISSCKSHDISYRLYLFLKYRRLLLTKKKEFVLKLKFISHKYNDLYKFSLNMTKYNMNKVNKIEMTNLTNSRKKLRTVMSLLVNTYEKTKRDFSYNTIYNKSINKLYTTFMNIVSTKNNFVFNVSWYYFFLYSIKTVQHINSLFHTNNFLYLKSKKTVLHNLKVHTASILKNLKYSIFLNRKYFFDFCNTVLNEKQWLVGPTNKIRLLKYFYNVSYKIKTTFNSINKYVRQFETNKWYFYYNSLNIRKGLLMALFKMRYKEEFILLNNKTWVYNYYLKTYYNMSIKEVSNYYRIINRKYNILLVKDLFLFLEYEVSFFIKKYLSYGILEIKNIYLNRTLLKTNKNIKTFFFIGDYLNIEYKSYFDKFMIFFNFIYFLDPIKYRNKFTFLHKLYNKVYNLLNKQVRLSKRFKHNYTEFDITHSTTHSTTHSNNTKYINILKKVLCHKNNSTFAYYKLYIKSLLFFVYKNHIYLYMKKEQTFTFFNSLLDNTYSFLIDTCYKMHIKLKLIEYNITNILPRRNNRRVYYKAYRRNRNNTKNKFFWVPSELELINSNVNTNIYTRNWHSMFFLKKHSYLKKNTFTKNHSLFKKNNVVYSSHKRSIINLNTKFKQNNMKLKVKKSAVKILSSVRDVINKWFFWRCNNRKRDYTITYFMYNHYNRSYHEDLITEMNYKPFNKRWI